MAMNAPNCPNDSGPYMRVITGAKAMVIAWATADPVATANTLRTKGRWLRSLSVIGKVRIFVLISPLAFCQSLLCTSNQANPLSSSVKRFFALLPEIPRRALNDCRSRCSSQKAQAMPSAGPLSQAQLPLAPHPAAPHAVKKGGYSEPDAD